MRWILLDIALVLLSVGVLAILLLRLFRKVKALTRAIGAAVALASAVPRPFTGSSPARQTRAHRGA